MAVPKRKTTSRVL
jgi:hypothetical protein